MHTNQSALVTGTDEEEIQSGVLKGFLLLDLFFLLTVGGGESNSTFSLH
jgi:hypothetical protein